MCSTLLHDLLCKSNKTFAVKSHCCQFFADLDKTDFGTMYFVPMSLYVYILLMNKKRDII